jgi:actin-related protein 5
MLQNFCEFSPDYQSQLRLLKDPLNLHMSERVIQFPFALPVADEKTEEELARIAEKRKEQGRKLQEMAARSRQEKVFWGDNSKRSSKKSAG